MGRTRRRCTSGSSACPHPHSSRTPTSATSSRPCSRKSRSRALPLEGFIDLPVQHLAGVLSGQCSSLAAFRPSRAVQLASCVSSVLCSFLCFYLGTQAFWVEVGMRHFLSLATVNLFFWFSQCT